MNKEIIYGGYTATPSDYECPDGDLAMSVDMIQEDGALKPIVPSTDKLQLADGQRILFIHDTSDYKHFIILSGSSLLWLDKSATSVDGATQFYTDASGINAIESVGNTLIVNIKDSGLHYFLWENDSSEEGGKYKYLGQCPPDIGLEFKLETKNSVEEGRYVWEAYTISAGDEITNVNMLDGIMGMVNKQMKEVKEKSEFSHPFFVRYAYRMYDGSFCYLSAPIYMLPCDGQNPQVIFTNSQGEFWGDPVQFVKTFSCALKARMASSSTEDIAKWREVISGICIFVSAQFLSWSETGESMEMEKEWSSFDNYMMPFNFGYGVVDATKKEIVSYRDIAADRNELQDDIDKYLHVSLFEKSTKTTIDEWITQVCDFYMLKEYDLDDLSTLSSWTTIERKGGIANLETFEQLTDAFEPRAIKEASSLHSYNNRLNLANYKVRELPTFPIGDFSCFTQTANVTVESGSVTVFIEENGRYVTTEASFAQAESWGLLIDMPGFFYYPNTNAKYARVIQNIKDSAIHYKLAWLKLTQHPHLNGAYCYDQFYANTQCVEYVGNTLAYDEAKDTLKPSEISNWENVSAFDRKNYVSTSDVNNPFSFPATGVNAIGTGMIMGIATAAKALSQGQFGQFPLYAFCTDGVWALEVSTTGVYSAKQPITRDVCVCAESITSMDSAVLFATNRGIMLIEGSTSTCISDTLADYGDTDIFTSLPSMTTLLTLANYNNADLTVADFFEFVKTCRMVYDYTHQRIIVYRPSDSGTKSLAYVYSLKSKKWGLMAVSIAYTLNSYPDALAVSGDNKVIDFSASGEGEYANGLIVTRPIKLDPPDALKTVQSVIQRGFFRKGSVKCVLYGSRDLINWFTVLSSQDHYLRGFSGTPYKYFRIALVTSLLPSESVSGCSVLYAPRLTNKPR